MTVVLDDGLNDVAVAAAVHTALTGAGIAGVTVNTLGTNSTTVSYTLDGATFPVGTVPTVADSTLLGVPAVSFGVGVLASKTGSVGDLVVAPYAPTDPDSIVNLDGANSINETDNWVLSGSGNDVIVLSTGEYSNEVIELQGVFGKTLIVNFDDTAVARTNGGDYLDFTDYLNESGAAIEVVSGNANGNKVSIIDFNQLQGTDAGDLGASVQMGNVSGADLAAAINANFTVTGQNVFLINNDNATDAFDNVGEYLVVSTNGSSNIQIVGTLDFGAEINDLSAANLVQF